MRAPSASGFSLLELIVVLAISAMLAAVSVPALESVLSAPDQDSADVILRRAEHAARRRGVDLVLATNSERETYLLVDAATGDTVGSGTWPGGSEDLAPEADGGPWRITPLGQVVSATQRPLGRSEDR
ncbi:MAG: prepilin-type N-terminal cleavage/methylation domain-containing protein [Gemmatimonadota bacterium]